MSDLPAGKALEAAKERLEKAQECLDQALSVDEAAIKGMVAAIPRAIGKYRKAFDRIEDISRNLSRAQTCIALKTLIFAPDKPFHDAFAGRTNPWLTIANKRRLERK